MESASRLKWTRKVKVIIESYCGIHVYENYFNTLCDGVFANCVNPGETLRLKSSHQGYTKFVTIKGYLGTLTNPRPFYSEK